MIRAGDHPHQAPVEQQQRGQHRHAVADRIQADDRLVLLQARQQDGGDPDVRQQHQRGHHRQPVADRLVGEEPDRGDQPEASGRPGDDHQHRLQVGQHQIVALLEHAVGDEARVGKLERPGDDQTERDQVRHRDLELHHRRAGAGQRGRQQAHREDAEDRQHPRARADDARIPVGTEQRQQRAALEDASKLEPDSSHGAPFSRAMAGALTRASLMIERGGCGAPAQPGFPSQPNGPAHSAGPLVLP